MKNPFRFKIRIKEGESKQGKIFACDPDEAVDKLKNFMRKYK